MGTSPEPGIFLGIDWGGTDHQLCAVDEYGETLWKRRIAHTTEGMEVLDTVLNDCNDRPLRAAIERGEGLLVEHLQQRGVALYCISPKISSRARERYRLANTKSDAFDAFVLGAMLASQAAHNSQAAILAILNGEEPAFSAGEILQAVPTKVIVKPPRALALPTMQAPVEHEIGRAVPLEEWHDDYLRQLCFETIFPAYEDAGQGIIVRALGATLVDGGVSQDVGIAPEPAPSGPMGDFPLPAGGSGFG